MVEQFIPGKQAEVERLTYIEWAAEAGLKEYRTRAEASEALVADMREALDRLHSLVIGECPSLLNEDSDGDAKLDHEIRSLLSRLDTSKTEERS